MSDFKKRVEEHLKRGLPSLNQSRRELMILRRQYLPVRRDKRRIDAIRKIELEMDSIRVAMTMMRHKCDSIGADKGVNFLDEVNKAKRPSLDIGNGIVTPRDWEKLRKEADKQSYGRGKSEMIKKFGEENGMDIGDLVGLESCIQDVPELKQCDCGWLKRSVPLQSHSRWCKKRR